MDTTTVVTLLGGLGLFLLGIHHLTEGLKGLAGDSLRRTLQRLVAGRLSAVVSGVFFTAAIQSSTAATLTVIGFVSAGLVTLSQAVGVIVGATLGTTTTPWMVAIFGFRVRIATAALPILGVGALLWLVARGRTRSLGAILAGFGLIFTGIEYLQNGMQGVSWNLEALAGRGVAAHWILAGIGVVMTIVMQSSSAAAATTLVALDAGSVSFVHACAMIVGQSVGSAMTTALVVIGGGLAVRRAALAHIVFSLAVGVFSMLFLTPLVAAAHWVGTRLDDPDGVLALAAFSSIFKLAGIVAFFPWLDRYTDLIVRISGRGSDTAVARLEPTLAEAGGPVALEATWRAIFEVARSSVEVVRRRLAGESSAGEPAGEAVQQIEHFLESLRIETTDLGTIGPRLVQLCHALDHLAQVQRDLARSAAPAGGWQPPPAFGAASRALEAWLDATRDLEVAPDPAILRALVGAVEEVRAERRAGRDRVLEDVALQRTPTATARAALDSLAWAEDAVTNACALAESLNAAAAQ